jgi:hypothetical protein
MDVKQFHLIAWSCSKAGVRQKYIKRECSILPKWLDECHALFSENLPRRDRHHVQQNRHARSFNEKTRLRLLRRGGPAFTCYGVVDSPSLGCDAVEGVAIMIPARKNVSAADNRQKGQKACNMNACT